MFLEVKRSPMSYLQHKDMDPAYIAPITRDFRINMNFVAECSHYTIRENTTRKTLDNNNITVPVDTNVIHLEMSYTHSTHTHQRNQKDEHTINERYYFKLVFFPGAENEFLRIKTIIDRLTFSD
ncbi:Uncharacterised protein [BD1-7 clade bacterium]|uniref:Uncharacterized protein n=1 Tax=BD1-7 clade bacterium TaxID=2029982 RepID=A0A5S9QQ35_9GAMM|nr:Uncharacterised protein [BD1-7 clade bacterium]CAA0119267.1 Uncharacterised protein [BD1-7 clade bacterium]CAA0120641.1 Uncharacterised protein [BD1-7 clade bacterium]